MNKTKLTLISALAFLGIGLYGCSGCKENNPPLDFGHRSILDTTYVLAAGSVPAAQSHQILFEDFTGQSCANCPAAADQLDGYVIAHPAKINVISLYMAGTNPLTKPVNGYTHDLRDSSATEIDINIYNGYAALPFGGVDRIKYNGTTVILRDDWGANIAARLDASTPLNIDLRTAKNASGTMDTIYAKVTFTTGVSVPYNLSIAVVEDSMIDIQEKGLGFDTAYLFKNVLRGMVTPTSGTPLGPDLTTKEVGRVYEKAFTYTPKVMPAPNVPIDPLKCRVIAFVHGIGPDYTIVQSAQTPLRH